jgi:uncharacterized protein YcfL
MKFQMGLWGTVLACFLLTGCASTHWGIDPATRIVQVDTQTLFKSVEGFTLRWVAVDADTTELSVVLEKSSTEAQIIDAFAPLIKGFADMTGRMTVAGGVP